MDSRYIVIMTFVNQGFSEEVMVAAKPVGATGGTVFHSRQVDNEETLKFFGITIQEEREIVLILAEKENKLAINYESNWRTLRHKQPCTRYGDFYLCG